MEEENNIKTINSNLKSYKSNTEPKFESQNHLNNYNSMTDINNAKLSVDSTTCIESVGWKK